MMKRREALKSAGVLMGTALSIGTVSAMLQGCKTDPATILDWAPKVMSSDQIGLVGEIAELIMPRTDTPGAKDAMVDRRIDESIAANFESDEKEMFMAGLETFNTLSKEKFDKAFMALTEDEMKQVLDAQVSDAKATKEKDAGAPHIWPVLKGMVISSFFTSEVGATEVLKYDPVPGEWIACIDYSEVGGVWAL